MALRDIFKRTPEDADRDVEKTYAESPVSDRDRAESTKKARKTRRRLLIGLGIAAAVTTLMFPFAIGLAVTAAGAPGVALGGTAVLLGGAALGCDIGLIGAWAATRPRRRRGRSARDVENENARGMRHFERSQTKNLMSQLARRADAKKVADREKTMIERTKGMVDFVGVDKDIVDAYRSQPLSADEQKLFRDASKKFPGVDLVAKFKAKDKFTDDEVKELERVATTFAAHKDKDFGDLARRVEVNAIKLTTENYKELRDHARPSDEAARAAFGRATIECTRPIRYEGMVITTASGDEYLEYERGVTVRTKQAHDIFELQQAHLASLTGEKATLHIYVPDPTIKNRHQKADLDAKKEKDTKHSIAVAEEGAFSR